MREGVTPFNQDCQGEPNGSEWGNAEIARKSRASEQAVARSLARDKQSVEFQPISMRKDMSKVVIERPRRGHSLPSVKTGLRIRGYDSEEEYSELPNRISGRRLAKRSGWYKNFSDLLGPLRKFLRGNVGRPWDKVYSELSENLDKRKATGLHVFQHVEFEVALHCFEAEDGKIYDREKMNRHEHPVKGLYVHPRTRLLCWKEPVSWQRHQRAEQAKKPIRRVPIGGNQQYIKLKSIWYVGEMETYNHTQKIKGEPRPNELFTEGGTVWRVIRKRQCNSKELKAAGLKNDPIAEQPGVAMEFNVRTAALRITNAR
jgi:hypothetical protein